MGHDWKNMVIFHGLPWPDNAGVTEEMVGVLPTLPAMEDDIFIASFPRSGSFPLSIHGDDPLNPLW